MRKTMKKLTHGATRLLVLALGLGLASTVWAGLPTITVSGNDVTISTDNGSYGNIGTNNGGYDTLTIPVATDLVSGTILRIKSITFGARTSGTAAPASVVLAGVSSAAAEVTTKGYSDRDKYTYVFTTPCLMKVGTGSTISFRNAAGEQENVGLAASLTASTDQDDYLFTTLRSTSGDNKWSVLTEIVAEKVTGYINQTADGFNTTVTAEKVYVSGVTGYLNTVDAFGFGNVDELVVVDGAYTYGYKVVNGNSPQNNDTKCNRAVAFKKLSGTGTITNGDHGNGPTPVMGVCDSSEFAGSINIGSATTRLSVLFCTEAEISAGIGTSLGANLYSLFTSETGRSRIYVSAGRTTANNAVVTVPSGKTWTAVNGITNKGELVVDGTVSCNIVNDGTLTVNGTVTGTISGSGTVVVNEGATLASLGAQRDFTGWTIHSSVAAKITMSAEEYGKGLLSISGATGISSITVFAPDGTTVVTTLTPENGAATYNRGTVLVSGKACWYAWEMNGNLNGSGANTAGLSHDSGGSDANSFYNSSMLYTYRHPYTSVAFPATWTAVVRCTVPKVVNGTVITFGTKFTSFIGLIAGDDPETEMKLVRYNNGDEAYTVLATMEIVDGTSAQHVYIFSVENNSAVKVYCDGSLVLDDTFETFSLGNGIQIGSAYGGVAGGLVRMWAGDTYAGLTTEDLEEARIDCVRLYNYSLSAAQVAALSAEFPAIVVYRATAAADTDTTWTGGTLAWSPAWTGGNDQSKVILTTEGNARVSLPETITAAQLQFSLLADSTLTLAGPGSIAVTEPVDITGGTLELTGTMTLTRDATFNGKVSFAGFTKDGSGALKLSNGSTVAVTSGSVIVTPLGSYTCAQGTVVDSVYTGDGVKLIPLTSAVVSITQNGMTLYYSDLDTGVGTLNVIGDVSDDVRCELLNGTTWPTTPYDYAGILRTMGYYIDGNGILTKAVARIGSTTYPTLAAAVTAAADNATVTLLLASSETITLSDKAITLSETANFSGTLTGNGTLTFETFRNNPTITFDNWTGSVVLPSFAANGTILNKYGVTGSTVVLNGITSGWLGETSSQRMDVNPVLQLDGNVTITGFSQSWTYTFAEITGTGTFSLDPANNHPNAASITKVAAGFSGSIYSDIDTTLTIGTIDREAGTQVTGGMKLLTTSGSGYVTASALTVGGAAQSATLRTESDGIYVAVASVQKGENPATYHTTIADAMTEAGSGAATITLLANTSSDIALAVGQSLVTGGFSVGTVSTGATYYHVVNNAGVYTVVLDTYTITIPPVANTTVSVSYTSGGEAQVATAAGAITVDAGTSLTATWTAASGYKITAGASQTINPVAAAQTLTKPTVEAKGATVSGVTFNYGYDFATATVTAMVSGDATTYTLTVDGANYEGAVDGTTVTFSNVVTGHSSAYDSVSYEIAATDGTSPVSVSGGSGSAVVADSDTWVFENSGTTGKAAAKGSWTTAVTYNDNVAAVENNTFTANNCSTGDCVTATVNDLVYTSLSDTSDMSVIANDSQGAVALGETNVNEVTTMCFMILAKEDGDFVWKPATWGGNTPQLDTPYDIAVTFDYVAKKYSVCIDGTYLTVNGATKFDLCTDKSELKSITFKGEGTLSSIEGIESTGYMVKAANGTYYPTIAAAITAYNDNPAIGELYVLHDGTVPVGWMIIEVGGVKYLRKAPKGSLFIAF